MKKWKIRTEKPEENYEIGRYHQLLFIFAFTGTRFVFLLKKKKTFFPIENKKEEIKNFEIFLDFLKDLLNLDPVKRVPASKAIIHPFITNLEKFNEKIDVKLPFFENEEKSSFFFSHKKLKTF